VVLGALLALACGSPEEVSLGSNASSEPDPARVLGFVLVDVATQADIRPLADGDTIDTRGDPINVRAEVEPFDPGSVVFYIDGNWERTEERPPWMVAGNENVGEVFPWLIDPGTYRLGATPFDAPGGGGSPGLGLEQTFEIQ
jgi:hypothetical protein